MKCAKAGTEREAIVTAREEFNRRRGVEDFLHRADGAFPDFPANDEIEAADEHRQAPLAQLRDPGDEVARRQLGLDSVPSRQGGVAEEAEAALKNGQACLPPVVWSNCSAESGANGKTACWRSCAVLPDAGNGWTGRARTGARGARC